MDPAAPRPDPSTPPPQTPAAEAVETTLVGLGLPWSRQGEVFTVSLPGTHKLVTECALEVGQHTLLVRAFVARRPEQDEGAVHRWLLERNLRLVGVAFCLDHLGDVHLVGRLPLAQVDAAAVDALLGAVADAADSSFDPIVALGFADSIRREWVWRRSRGEPTTNLAAFAHLDPERVGGSAGPDRSADPAAGGGHGP